MYARQVGVGMSTLDLLILELIFILVAIEVARETKEQATASRVRRSNLPWAVPRLTAASLSRFGCTCVAWLLEACYSRAIPALIPFALLSLLTTQGADATSIVLNGLQVIFVLELDNRIPAVFVSLHEHDQIKDSFASLFAKERKQAAARTLTLTRTFTLAITLTVTLTLILTLTLTLHPSPSPEAFPLALTLQERKEVANQRRLQKTAGATLPWQRDTDKPRVNAAATFVVFVAALNIGFARTTGDQSNVPCEMLVRGSGCL